jgi:electron transport complex protein RnfB
MILELAIGLLACIGAGFATGWLLHWSARKTAAPLADTVESVNALLPQTQCGQCGYAGCRPYAAAIIDGEAINRCPPGGVAVIHELAELLGRPYAAPDNELAYDPEVRVAVIREDECIGCTKCIQACPVDAILGAARHMHTVIESECTGCDLCVDPCPVDCIDMVPAANPVSHWFAPAPGPRAVTGLIATDSPHWRAPV